MRAARLFLHMFLGIFPATGCFGSGSPGDAGMPDAGAGPDAAGGSDAAGGPDAAGAPDGGGDGGVAGDWLHTWGGTNINDHGQGIAVDGTGNTYVGGQTGADLGGAVLLKYSPGGSLLWARGWQLGAIAGAPDRFVALALSPAKDALYAAGFTAEAASLLPVLRKYDLDGNPIWGVVARLGVDGATIVGAGVAPDGHVFVGGVVYLAEGQRPFVARFTPAGTLDWAKAWSHLAADPITPLTAIAVAPDGGVYVAGDFLEDLDLDGTYDRNAFAGRLDPTTGAFLWYRAYRADSGSASGGGAAADGSALYTAGPGGCIACGAGFDVFASFLLKWDAATGALVWERWLAGAELGQPYFGLDVGPAGDPYLVGFREVMPSTNNVVAARFSAAGDLAWARRLETSRSMAAYGFRLTGGRLHITGAGIFDAADPYAWQAVPGATSVAGAGAVYDVLPAETFLIATTESPAGTAFDPSAVAFVDTATPPSTDVLVMRQSE